MPVNVKICGITRPEDARAAVAAGADYLGVNFWPGSPRAVDVPGAQAIAAVRGTVPLVGVFVDAPRAHVERIVAEVDLALLQFHGAESPAYCRGWGHPIVKAIRVPPGTQAAALAAAYEGVAYMLVDAYVEGQPGGTGRRVAAEALVGLPAARLFLAGGLDADNVADAVRAVRPFAVDVASGVEERPGVKNHEKIRRFIEHAKAA
jgi:phosphoribosylanthranilate isomerase